MIEAFTGVRKPRTAVAMLFGGGAKTLYLKLQGRRGRFVSLREVTAERLGEISAVPVSYFSRGYAGLFCIQRFTAYDDAGRVVARSGRQRCV